MNHPVFGRPISVNGRHLYSGWFFSSTNRMYALWTFFTELPDQPAGTYLSAKGSLYHFLHCKRNQQNRTILKNYRNSQPARILVQRVPYIIFSIVSVTNKTGRD